MGVHAKKFKVNREKNVVVERGAARGERRPLHAQAVENEAPPERERLETARLHDGHWNGDNVFVREAVAVEAKFAEARQEGGNGVVEQVVGELFSDRVVVIIVMEELLVAGKGRRRRRVQKKSRKRLDKRSRNRFGQRPQLPQGKDERDTNSQHPTPHAPQVVEARKTVT